MLVSSFYSLIPESRKVLCLWETSHHGGGGGGGVSLGFWLKITDSSGEPGTVAESLFLPLEHLTCRSGPVDENVLLLGSSPIASIPTIFFQTFGIFEIHALVCFKVEALFARATSFQFSLNCFVSFLLSMHYLAIVALLQLDMQNRNVANWE